MQGDISPLSKSKGFLRILENDGIADATEQFQANLLAASDELVAECIRRGTLVENGFISIAAAIKGAQCP